MNFSTQSTCWRRFLCMLPLVALANVASAQGLHRGVWAQADLGAGLALSSTTSAMKQQLTSDGQGTSTIALTLGYHLSPRWDLGVGIAATRYNNPYDLNFVHWYLDARYRPFRQDLRFFVEGRAGSVLSTGHSFFSVYDYDAKYRASLSAGYELKLSRRWSFVPAVELSYCRFSYNDLATLRWDASPYGFVPRDYFKADRMSAGRFAVQLRLGISFN